MAPVSRRDMLRALGYAGCASALLPFVPACQRGRGPSRLEEVVAALDSTDLHKLLRVMVGNLSRVFDRAEGWIEHGTRTRIATDGDGHQLYIESNRRAILTGMIGRDLFVRTTSDVSVEGLAQTAAALRIRGGKVRRSRNESELRRIGTRPKKQPLQRPSKTVSDVVADLLRRADLVRDSRIIYRGAGVYLDDRQVIYVGPAVEYIDRRTWSQSTVVLGAKTPTGFTFESETAAGDSDLDAAKISDASIARAADNALTILTPRAAPDGTMNVLASPDVTAALIAECLGPALDAAVWLDDSKTSPLAAVQGAASTNDLLTLIASPGADGSGFDDEGSPIVPLTLVDRGVVTAPYANLRSAQILGLQPSGNGWRSTLSAAPLGRAPHLAVSPGALGPQELLAAVEEGLVLEGAAIAQVELSHGRYRARVRRARGIKKGVLSGFVYGDIAVEGQLGELISTAIATGNDTVDHHHLDAGGMMNRRSTPSLAFRSTVRGQR